MRRCVQTFDWYCIGIDRTLNAASHLGVGDDLQVEGVLVLQPLDGGQGDPQVVGVEDLELGDGLELVHVGLGHLGDLQKAQLSVVLSERTTL